MVNISGSEKLLKNVQPVGPTFDDVMSDINLHTEIKCIKTHDWVYRPKSGSYEPFRYEKGMIMNRCNVVLKVDYWVLN